MKTKHVPISDNDGLAMSGASDDPNFATFDLGADRHIIPDTAKFGQFQ